jgi:enterochelin esterase-like enzyme
MPSLIDKANNEEIKRRGPSLLTARLLAFAMLVFLAACGTSVRTADGQSPTPELPATDSPSPSPSVQESFAASPTPFLPAPITHTPSPTACAETQGAVSQHTLPSKYLADGLRFTIYLPPCFAAYPTRIYPVLYLFHGQTYSDDQWVRLGATVTAARLISDGEVPPFIIVMPYDKSSAQPWQDPFDQAFQEELLPYVETNYRACAERTCRAVGGLSRGGGWSIHYGLTRPDLFSEVGGHSPAIFDSEGPRLSRLLDAIPPDLMPRWFLDVGIDDRLVTSASQFEQDLAARDIPHDWRLYTGVHNEAYWSSHVEEYLRWYAEGWEQ